VETLLELSEPAVLANVRPIRHRVMRAAQRAGAAGSVVDEVGLCVGEAAANAARHAYDGEPGTIGALVQADELSLTVTVRDRGSGLDPPGLAHTAVGSDRLPEEDGGFGLRIIESLARDVSIWSAPGRGTVLRMRFSLEAPRTRHGSVVGQLRR
jgi:anti-sigma regulatory factor (Ser/Thr protein kinase)